MPPPPIIRTISSLDTLTLFTFQKKINKLIKELKKDKNLNTQGTIEILNKQIKELKNKISTSENESDRSRYLEDLKEKWEQKLWLKFDVNHDKLEQVIHTVFQKTDKNLAKYPKIDDRQIF